MNETDKQVADTTATPDEISTPVDESVTPVVATADTESKPDTTVPPEADKGVTETSIAADGEATSTAVTDEHEAPVETAVAASEKKSLVQPKMLYIVGAVVVVSVLLLGLVYVMEKQGKLTTGVFTGVHTLVDKNTAVALVNNAKINKYDLDVSISQMTTGAQLQGADVTDPALVENIKTQAIDMLVNTELLRQEAAAKNIVVTDADVDARLETLTADLGGAEELTKRMAEFNIDEETLRRDIKSELTIQNFLKLVFAERITPVSEEEILTFYDTASEGKDDFPPLEEVKKAIADQLSSAKEQEIVVDLVEELRAKATIETKI